MTEVFYFKLPSMQSPDFANCNDYVVSQEEKVKAQKMAPMRRQEFLICRTVLRKLLGKRLGLQPEWVPIVIDQLGKPILESDSYPELTFSIAHSSQWGVIAISNAKSIGIDIEEIRPINLNQSFLEEVLHREEIEQISNLTEESERFKLFFRYWTIKESYTKALGQGFLFDFSSIKAAEIGSLTLEFMENYLLSISIMGDSDETLKLYQLSS